MYTVLDVIAQAERSAVEAATADRMRYVPFIEAAERFAAAQQLVVGGASATRALLGGGGPPGLGAFRYEFYSGAAIAHARALADALHAVDGEGLGRYVTVRTKVPGHRLTIEVDGRDMFTIIALHVRRGVRLIDVMVPSRRPAMFARDAGGAPLELLCAGAEVQLIEIYSDLCNPARAGTCGELLAAEAVLRGMFEREIQGKVAKATGGVGGNGGDGDGGAADGAADGAAAEGAAGLSGVGRDLLARASDLRPALSEHTGGRRGRAERAERADRGTAPAPDGTRARLRDVLLRYAAGPSRVLLGAAAAALLAGAPPRRGAAAHVQVATASRLEADAEEIAVAARRAGVEVEWAVNDPHLPLGPRLRRLVVHASIDGGPRELVLDAYNAAEYELVPYTEEALATGAAATGALTLRAGTPFALMRFRLIDMWTIQVLLKMGAIDASGARGVLRAILLDFTGAAAAYAARAAAVAGGDAEAAAAAADRVLPLDAYIGRYEDPDVTLKREAQKSGRAFRLEYMPFAAARGPALSAGPRWARDADADDAAGHYDDDYS